MRSKTMSAKASGAPRTVDEYIAHVPEPARSTLNKVRAVIRSAVPPEATEVISYGIPAFKYKGLLVGFGGFSRHCSFFVMSTAVMARFEKQLTKYNTRAGTIHFLPEKPLPVALVKKLIRARIQENEARQK